MNRLVCAPKTYAFAGAEGELDVVLFNHADLSTQGSIGDKIRNKIRTTRLKPSSRAWDFLSLALSVIAADSVGRRNKSPDGWTREFELKVAVDDPVFWNSQHRLVEKLLGFLTTDLWSVSCVGGGFVPVALKKVVEPKVDCVMLLSGGLDSLIGCIDLVKAGGHRPFCVSQVERCYENIQESFPLRIGNLEHLILRHTKKLPNEDNQHTQRSRSLVFLAYGILVATSLKSYHEGQDITLYVCENGYISINPPLTGARLGSLSTRTTHPHFLGLVQQLLDFAGLRVRIVNPYQLKTKGEMLRECRDQTLLKELAPMSISCGRYQRLNIHCGRCLPCLVRRAAFRASDIDDSTKYKFAELGREDAQHAGFDDVRAVAMANLEVNSQGIQRWIGPALSTSQLGDTALLEATVGRGLSELGALLSYYAVK